MAKTKTVYVVRKHITDYATKKDLRYEDYDKQFGTPEEATQLLRQKEEKYRQTLQDYMDDEGETPEEGRWYEVVPIQVPV